MIPNTMVLFFNTFLWQQDLWQQTSPAMRFRSCTSGFQHHRWWSLTALSESSRGGGSGVRHGSTFIPHSSHCSKWFNWQALPSCPVAFMIKWVVRALGAHWLSVHSWLCSSSDTPGINHVRCHCMIYNARNVTLFLYQILLKRYMERENNCSSERP